MAFNLINQPQDVSLAGNDMKFFFALTILDYSPGVNTRLCVVVTSQDGDVLEICVKGCISTFTFVDNPTGIFELPTGNNNAAAVVSALQATGLFTEWGITVETNNRICFTSLEFEDCEISFTFNGQDAGDLEQEGVPIVINDIDATAEIYVSSKVAGNSPVKGKIIEVPICIDSLDFCVNVAPYLFAYMSSLELDDFPAWCNNRPTKHSYCTINYKLVVKRESGDGKSSIDYMGADKCVILGGMSHKALDQLSGSSYFDSSDFNGWLSHSSGTQFISSLQQATCSFLSMSDVGGLKTVYELFCEDGTSVSVDVDIIDTNYAPGGVYSVPAGPSEIMAAPWYPPDCGCLLSYTIRVLDANDDIVADEKEFIVRKHVKGSTYFSFKNSLGGFESICISPKRDYSYDRSYESATSISGECIQYCLENTAKETGAYVLDSVCLQNQLKELAHSTDVRMQVYQECYSCPDPKNGTWCTVKITDTNYDLLDSADIQNTVNISWQSVYTDRFYSPILSN